MARLTRRSDKPAQARSAGRGSAIDSFVHGCATTVLSRYVRGATWVKRCFGPGGSRLVGEVFAGRGRWWWWPRLFSKRLLTSGSVQPRHHMGATGGTLGSAAALI